MFGSFSCSIVLVFFQLLKLILDSNLLAFLELLAIFKELIKLEALRLIFLEVIAEVSCGGNTRFLRQLHLLNQYLSLHFISLFNGFGTEVWTWDIPHAWLRHISGLLLIIIKTFV